MAWLVGRFHSIDFSSQVCPSGLSPIMGPLAIPKAFLLTIPNFRNTPAAGLAVPNGIVKTQLAKIGGNPPNTVARVLL